MSLVDTGSGSRSSFICFRAPNADVIRKRSTNTPTSTYCQPQFTLQSNIAITPKLECSYMLGKGNPGTNIPIHPTDSDYDTPDRNNMHLQTLKPQVRTPDRGYLLTSSLITPPDSVERPPAPIPSFPQHVFPPIPRTMSELTLSLLGALSRCLTYSPIFPIKTPTTPSLYQTSPPKASTDGKPITSDSCTPTNSTHFGNTSPIRKPS
ncbi:hypothetical protein BGX38DRAFT_1277769 [Terfezia claveryi]|nr:hypothetical protein BGX38DRAFT_1277769 [Terfezia claveryi]